MTPCEQADTIFKINEQMVEGRLQFQKIDSKLEHMDIKQDEILGHVKKTNGRVSKLESFRNAVQWTLIGALALMLLHSIGITEFLKECIK